jgi:hypothetical protein
MPNLETSIASLLLEPSLPLASVLKSRRYYAGALRIIRGTSYRSFPEACHSILVSIGRRSLVLL